MVASEDACVEDHGEGNRRPVVRVPWNTSPRCCLHVLGRERGNLSGELVRLLRAQSPLADDDSEPPCDCVQRFIPLLCSDDDVKSRVGEEYPSLLAE